MASAVGTLSDVAGVSRLEAVPWLGLISSDEPGVYVVARTSDPAAPVNAPAAIDMQAVGTLLDVRPELLVNGRRPSQETLAQRLTTLWLADEPVIYVGLASRSLRTRIRDFYRTKVGARSPHAGGWPVKCLADLEQTWVHFAECDDVLAVERKMLEAFIGGVTPTSRSALSDPDLPLPYANLEIRDSAGHRRIKRHGISGAKAPR